MGSQTTPPKMPVIDLSPAKLKAATAAGSWKSLVGEVVHALEEYGCFVAVYDNVPVELHNQVMESVEELFNLPREIKARNVAKEPRISYYPPWYALPLTEAFTFRDAATVEGTERFTNLIWPAGNQTACDRFVENATLLGELLELVRKMLMEGYGVDHKGYEYDRVGLESVEYHVGLSEQKTPTEANTIDKDVMAHTDRCLLTAVDQNEIKALEVKTRDGQWIAFDPAPSHYFILAGDAIMGWSNGRIYSPRHMHGPRGPGKKSNYLFHLSSYMRDLVEIPKELVDDKHPLLFKPFDNVGLLRFTEANHSATIADYCGVHNDK